MLASTVAPPYAKLYDSTRELFCSLTMSPTQFAPPAAVHPGKGGLPSGFAAEGFAPLGSKPVWEYESPLKDVNFHFTDVVFTDSQSEEIADASRCVDCSALSQDATHGSKKKFGQHDRRLDGKAL